MKAWILAVFLGATTLGSADAWACQARAPVPSSEVLRTRAAELDAQAAKRESAAATFDREADALTTRARAVRAQAVNASPTDRTSLLAVADELVDRARTSRSNAASERTQAAALRASAKALRERAVQVTNTRWRKAPVSTDI